MPAAADSGAAIRINQVGYLPNAPKVAVVCVLVTEPSDRFARFIVRNESGRVVYGPRPSLESGAFGPCAVDSRERGERCIATFIPIS